MSLLLIFFVAKIVYDDKILKEYLHEFEKKNLEIEEKIEYRILIINTLKHHNLKIFMQKKILIFSELEKKQWL